jgi:hypothetical protein
MAEVPAKTTYLVSKQSNRSLVLNGGVAEVPVGTLNEAKTAAERATRTTGQPHYVHEIRVKTLYAFKPGPAIESEIQYR